MSLAWRMLLRDWRAGELRILFLALVVAVASVTSVAFFADRVAQALVRDAHQMIGADLLLTADRPIGDAYADEARSRGLATASATTFISMARHGESAQLSAVKAVSDTYPLRGRLRTAPGVNVPDEETRGIPEPGSVWVDERFVAEMAVKPGDTLELGDASLRVAAVLTLEPDRGVTFFNVAPRIMMNLADVPRTGLVQVGSRVTYQFYVAGERPLVDAFTGWLKPRLERGQQVQGLDNARPEIRQSLDRARQFLGLTSLLAVILAAVAIALAARRYVRRHLDGYAVMRCLGATQSRLFGLFAGEFVLLGLAGALGGLAVGFVAQEVIGYWLASLVNAKLPLPSWLPAVQGVVIGLVLLLGFALPPLLQLKNVPAIRVIRRDVGLPKTSAIAGYLIGLGALAALLVWQAGDAKLGLTVLGGFAAAFVLFSVVGYGALRALAATGGWGGITWRYGLANLRRRGRENTVQILALSLGLAAILLLTFTRGDLVDAWRGKIPVDAPNRFVLNIQPDQLAPVERFFADNALPAPIIYPMVRGRLTAINGRPVSVDDYADDRTKRLVEREFNLSYMDALPGHNQVVAGRWFDREALRAGALSVEQGIAKNLGVGIGDTLTWTVAGRSFSARITNLRKLDWDSMRVNFFVITPPALLSDFPTSFITSFHLPATQSAAMAKLTNQFPNLTVVDMSAIIRQALTVMEQVVRAVQFVFLFALGAGVLVLYAALAATQDERLHEAGLMRALGASRAQVAAAHRTESLAVGLLAGFLASCAAVGIGAALAIRVFQFEWHVNPWIWVAGPLLGLVCVAASAWSGTRAAVRQPPIVALREA